MTDLGAVEARLTRFFAERPLLQRVATFFFGVAAVLLLTRLGRATISGMPLPNEIYSRPVIFWELLREPIISLQLGAVSLIFVVFWRHLTWDSFEHPKLIRGFVFAVTLPLAWAYSTYDFNFFYGQAHIFDRLLLVALCVGVWRHPAALPAFLTLVYAIPAQLAGDVPAYLSWNDKWLLYNVLILVTAYLFLKVIWQRSLHVFVYLLLVMIAASYWEAGAEKIAISWWSENHLHHIIASAHVNGWFFNGDSRVVLGWLDILRVLDPLLMGLSLVIELAAILLLLRRRLSLWIVPGFIVLHVMIFLTTGIFFWKWIWLDIALIFLLLRLDADLCRRIFWWPVFLLSILLIPWADDYLDPWGPAWKDSRLNVHYLFEGTGESGHLYAIDRWFFAPYDLIFTQNRFFFLTRDHHLVDTYGTARSQALAQAVEVAGPDLAALRRAGERIGKIYYDAGKVERFDAFLRRFFAGSNRQKSKKVVPSWIQAPHHIWSLLDPHPLPAYQRQEPIRRIDIYQQMHYYDGREILLLERRLAHSVEIPPDNAP